MTSAHDLCSVVNAQDAVLSPRLGLKDEGPPLVAKSAWRRLAPLLLIVVGGITYANSLRGVFLFDDAYAIVDNVRIRNLWPLSPFLATERPLVELSLAINYAVGQLDVAGYHIFNIAVHIAAALTLYGLLRRTLSRAPVRPSFGETAAPIGFAVALLWLVHPLQTQGVTYVIQRGESMMGLFYLVTLYGFTRAVGSPHPVIWLLISVVCSALAMASKAVAVTIPVAVLLYDRCFITGDWRTIVRQRWGYYLVLCSTWGVLLACGIARQIVLPESTRTAIGFGYQGVSPLQYAMTQPEILLHYLRLSIWPESLCLDYAWPAARGLGQTVVPLTIVGLVAVVSFCTCLRGRWLGFMGSWFFLILLPTSSIIPIRDLAFEHRMYLPLASVICVCVIAIGCAGCALVVRMGGGRRAQQRLMGVLVAIAAAGLAARTVARNADYYDDLGMWRDVAAKQPHNARAQVNIGVLLERRKDVTGAVEAYQAALELDFEYTDAHYNMGVARLRLRQFDEAEREFQEVARLAPDDVPAHAQLAELKLRRGDLAGAVVNYREVLRVLPRDVRVRAALANVLARLEHWEEAAAELRRVVEFRPSDLVARINLGNCLGSLGRRSEAIEEYRQALRIDPTSGDGHFNLARALQQDGQTAGAIDEYRMTLRLNPSDHEARLGLGVALRSAGQTAEAEMEFRQVLTQDPNNATARKALTEIEAAGGR